MIQGTAYEGGEEKRTDIMLLSSGKKTVTPAKPHKFESLICLYSNIRERTKGRCCLAGAGR